MSDKHGKQSGNESADGAAQARLQEQIDLLKRANLQMQLEVEAKKKEVHEKTREIQRIHNSSSWRVTRPLRTLGPSIRKSVARAGSLRNDVKDFVQTRDAYLFSYRAAGYLTRRIAPRYAHRFGAGTTHELLRIRKWYAENRKPVTVVIPSYNDYKLLGKCLESINRTTDSSSVKIIIVDDASPDPAHRAFLKSIARENVKVIFNEENGGFARAVNTGMRAVEAGDVIVLNSDTTANKLWLEALQFGAYLDEGIGIVGPKLLYPDHTIQYAGSFRKPDNRQWFDHYYRFRPSWYGPANVPNYAIGITGACMYIKRKVIERIGYMDENFPMAFEDMDYCLRAWKEGLRSYYFPRAVLIHHESATRDTKQGERETESLRYFWEKWGDWFDGRNVFDADGRLRVIYVLQATGVGGGHRLVFEHINRLKELGVAVELYALEGQPEWFPLKVTVNLFENYSQLIGALEQQEAIKVATWWETAEPVWLASVNRGIPVYYVQDIETSYYRDDVQMQQVVLSRYRHEFNYLTESYWNMNQLEEMGLEADMIGCGIDADVFRPTGEPREKNVLLSLGRSNYLKNLPMTLEAWKGITSNQPRLWMFGIEPQLAEGLDNAEYFVRPPDEEVNSLYNRATVFVQSSRHEGFCLPVLEAMAAGAPVICTDAHGNADFCDDGKNCLMVDQGDVASLRDAIERLLGNETLQEQLRQGGYATAATYSWPVVMGQIKQFYEDLAGAPVWLGSR